MTTPHARRAIPGPRGTALWRFLFRFPHAPQQRLLDLVLEHGEIVELNFIAERVVVVACPEYIEHVLHHRHQNYDKQTARWEAVRQAWGTGLLVADGDLWRRQRQRMQPAFHQEALRRFGAIVVEESERIAEVWRAAAAAGQVRDIYKDTLAGAVRAITRSMFGTDVESKTNTIYAALADVHDYINPMSIMNVWRVPPAVQRLVHPDYPRFRRAYQVIHGIFDDIITRRIAAPPAQADLLGMMMAARDDETDQTMSATQLHDEMMGMLMAGHETTGIATTWSFHWLSKHPDVEARFHGELDAVLGGRLPTFEDLPKLTYTRMILQESLRITPPTWGIDRRAREDDEIDGYLIRKGTKVALSPFVVHHLPNYWPDPERFDPERFTDAQEKARPTYAYFPFGGGPRRCVGMRFAMAEAQLMLAVLGQSFSLRLQPGAEVFPVARTTLVPHGGVPMTVRPRVVPASAPASNADSERINADQR